MSKKAIGGIVAAAAAGATAALLLTKTEKGQEVLEKAKKLGTGLIEDAKEFATDVAGEVKETFDNAVTTGKDLAASGIDMAQEGLGNLRDKIKHKDTPAPEQPEGQKQ